MLPVAILSRSFQVRLDAVRDIKGYLRLVAEKSGYTIDDDSLECVEYISDGSVRQALSRLEQLAIMCDFKITSDATRKALGIAAATSISRLLQILETGNAQDLGPEMQAMTDIPAMGVLRQLVREIRSRMLNGTASNRLIGIGSDLAEASLVVNRSQYALEICLGYAMINNTER